MLAVHAIIPTHNAPSERLERAVASALACDAINRVWVVDDGSSPTPVRIGGALRDERAAVLRRTNGGPSSARNTGLDAAEGAEAVVLLDDDDILDPEGVGAAIAMAERAAAVVSARWESRPRSGKLRLGAVPKRWRGGQLEHPSDVFTPISLFGASGVVVGRAALRAGLRFDESLWIGEDRDFLRKCAEHGPIAINTRPALTVTIHGDSAGNLSGVGRLERRLTDHLVLLDRHHEPSHDRVWRDATLWLMNRIMKSGVEVDVSPLAQACRTHGWALPLKTRLHLWRTSRRRSSA